MTQHMENWILNLFEIKVPLATYNEDPERDNGDEDEAEDEEDCNHSSARSVLLLLQPKVLMTLRLILTWSKFHLRDWLALSFQG